VFSVIQYRVLKGGIVLGLAHGLVSSGLFICAGGVVYDRSHGGFIINYRGIAQIMPIFSTLFFILCLANAGTPLTINFVGEFLSLYGAFERLPVPGAMSASSIVFSAAYTIFMFNRIAFGGSLSKSFEKSVPDLNLREFYILAILVIFTVVLGIYPAPILDSLHYSVSTLIYNSSDSYTILACIPFTFVASQSCTPQKTRCFFFLSRLPIYSLVKTINFNRSAVLLASRRELEERENQLIEEMRRVDEFTRPLFARQD
jgi:NADH:ubiquinone oxidoreductase subunit 4 (subunit M)